MITDSRYWSDPKERERCDNEHAHAKRLIVDQAGHDALEAALDSLEASIGEKEHEASGVHDFHAPWMMRD